MATNGRPDALLSSRILAVDDEEDNLALLENIIAGAGFRHFRTTTQAAEAVLAYPSFRPDLVIVDLHMPHIDGFELIEEIRSLAPPGTYLPILVLTSDDTTESKRRALRQGATDFMTKPFDPVESIQRMRILLNGRRLHKELERQKEELERTVDIRTRELEDSQRDTLQRLATAAEFRDDETGAHTHRVGALASRIARSLGMPAPEVQLVEQAAPLHDLGKIGIPDRILLKPGKLTDEEFTEMKGHTALGWRILKGSRSPLLRMAGDIALSHHEWWDGSRGYTPGVSGEEIPLAARITSVADVYDALTNDRPYKSKWDPADAVALIKKNSGSQFDPAVVDAFLSVQESKPQ